MELRHVWMFDCQTKRWANAAIKAVAQEGDYYSPEVEARLAVEVESAGHAALSLLRNGRELNAAQRDDLGYYIAVMVMRGPKKRRRGWELAPRVLDSTMDELRTTLQASQEQHDNPRLRALLAEADRIEVKFREETPATVQELIQSPWPSSQVIAAIQGMTWRFIRVPNTMFLISGDSPAFFFDEYGLGSERAELTFPINATLALLGSHQGAMRATLYLAGWPALVKEINRRIASGVERFIFSPKKQEWIETIALRRKPNLSLIAW